MVLNVYLLSGDMNGYFTQLLSLGLINVLQKIIANIGLYALIKCYHSGIITTATDRV